VLIVTLTAVKTTASRTARRHLTAANCKAAIFMVARYDSGGCDHYVFSAAFFLSHSTGIIVRLIYTILSAFDTECSNLDCSAIEIIIPNSLREKIPQTIEI
jgi:hypothetical protein